MAGFWLDPSISFILAAVIFFIIAAGVLFVLWIATPFSVFGVKGLLSRLIEEQAETNRLLKDIQRTLDAKGAGEGKDGPGDGV